MAALVPHSPPAHQQLRLLLLVVFSTLLFSPIVAQCQPPGAGAVLFSSQALAAGSIVTVPAGQTWVFDLPESPVLGGVHVYGKLLFDETQDSFMHTYHVTVHDGGQFLLGRCDCPHPTKATIELHLQGSDQTRDDDGIGAKVLGALSGGRIELYGHVRGVSWTQLAAPASPGQQSISVTDPTEWQVGDKFVLVGTSYVPSWYPEGRPEAWNGLENEELTVVSVAGTTINFSPALQFAHQGETLHEVEMRAEVGRLTRNIVVQGDVSSDSDQFGAHLMFLAGSVAKLSAVEVTRAGQQGHLGRYPIHFHRFGDASGLEVVDCSVHHNYQRSITLHAVDQLLVARNVLYHTFGHSLFLEDGIERMNTLAHNLIVSAFRLPETILAGIRSDDTPALIWLTNPENRVVGNHVAYSPNHAIWYAMPVHPTGPSATTSYIARHAPLGEFAHNLAHSIGLDGLHVDSGPDRDGQPGGNNKITSVTVTSADGEGTTSFSICDGYCPYASADTAAILSSGRARAHFDHFTAYKVGDRGIWTRGGPHTFSHLRFAGCRTGIILAVQRFSRVTDSIFVGMLPGSEDQFGDFPVAGYRFYDGPNEIVRSKFFRYEPTAAHEASGVSMLLKDEFSISALNHAHQLTFDALSKKVHLPYLMHSGDIGAVFVDVDGSVTGRPGTVPHVAAVVNNHPFHRTPGCVEGPGAAAYFCPNHFVSFHVRDEATPRNMIPDPAYQELPGPWKITRRDKTSAPLHICTGPCNTAEKPATQRRNTRRGYSSLMLYRDYYVHWVGAEAPPSTVQFVIGAQGSHVNEDASGARNELRLGACYPPGSTVQSVTWGWKASTVPAASFAELLTNPISFSWSTKGDGMWFHDTSTGYVWVRMVIAEADKNLGQSLGEPTGDHLPESFYATIRMATVGAGQANCATPGTSEVADTLRTLPSVATPSPASAFEPLLPEPAPSSWGECSGVAPPASVDCVVSEWSAFAACSASCDGGSQSRSRTVVTAPSGAGVTCPPLSESQPCNQQACAAPLVMDLTLTAASGVTSIATGTATLTLHADNRLEWAITHTVAAPQNAHIHHVGGVLVDMSAATSPLTGVVQLDSAQVSTLCVGTSYLNVHSDAHASGELQAVIPVDCVVPDHPDTPCEVSEFGEWTACTGTCGTMGTRTRKRTVTVAPTGAETCPTLEQTESCTMDACAVDCVVGEWAPFADCSVACGGGAQSRTRAITTQPTNGGDSCPVLSESQECNTHACSVDCVLGEWGPYSTCNQPCGPGATSRSRSVQTNASNGGTPCPPAAELTETTACNLGECSVDCELTPFGSYSACTAECGGGQQTRTRSVVHEATGEGQACPDPTTFTETIACNEAECPVDCVQSAWSEWSTCTALCDGGTRDRARSTTTESAGEGIACGPVTEQGSCNTEACVDESVDCTYNEWSDFSACSVACGGGLQTRTRSSNAAQNGGAACTEPLQEQLACHPEACPQVVDCSWNEWGAYETCSVSCGGGFQSRARTFIAAVNGGAACVGDTSEIQSCNSAPCATTTECVVSEWSAYSACSVACGGGSQSRNRDILTSPSLDAAPCPGLSETTGCNAQACQDTTPVDCVVGAFGAWDTCSTSCLATRSRAVVMEASNGGQACPALTETVTCAGGACPSATPIDCVVSDFGQWGECDCAAAEQLRVRTVLVPNSGGGAACPHTTDHQYCTCQASGTDAADGVEEGEFAPGFPMWAFVVAVVVGVAVLGGVGFAIYWFAVRTPAQRFDSF